MPGERRGGPERAAGTADEPRPDGYRDAGRRDLLGLGRDRGGLADGSGGEGIIAVPKAPPFDAAARARALELYKDACASCHGDDLRGTDKGPSHLSRVYEPGHHSDASFVSAIRNGRSVDSTMGFTALDGLPMGTRCGSIDPGVLLYLMDERGMDARGEVGIRAAVRSWCCGAMR